MKYEVGQLVRSTVTQLANFGAFARIEDGIEGLIHVSELSEQRIGHPRQVVAEGQDLILRIIRIDPARRRMGLSLRRALEATDEEVTAALGEDAVALKHELLAQEIEPDESEEAEPVETSDESEDVDSEEDASDAGEDTEVETETVAEVESEPEDEQVDDAGAEDGESATEDVESEAAASETDESEPEEAEEPADSDDESAEEEPRADDGTERAG